MHCAVLYSILEITYIAAELYRKASAMTTSSSGPATAPTAADLPTAVGPKITGIARRRQGTPTGGCAAASSGLLRPLFRLLVDLRALYLVADLPGQDLLDGGGDDLAAVGLHVLVGGKAELIGAADGGRAELVTVRVIGYQEIEWQNHSR